MYYCIGLRCLVCVVGSSCVVLRKVQHFQPSPSLFRYFAVNEGYIDIGACVETKNCWHARLPHTVGAGCGLGHGAAGSYCGTGTGALEPHGYGGCGGQ